MLGRGDAGGGLLEALRAPWVTGPRPSHLSLEVFSRRPGLPRARRQVSTLAPTPTPACRVLLTSLHSRLCWTKATHQRASSASLLRSFP